MAFIAILNIVIAVAFIAYSYAAASELRESGALLSNGDTEAAGNTLYQAGEKYLNIIKAGFALLIVGILISIVAASNMTTAEEIRIEQEYEEVQSSDAADESVGAETSGDYYD